MSGMNKNRDGEDDVVEMDVDDALESGGPCGISQILLQVLFMTACVTVCYHAIESYFTGHSPPWKCVLDLNTTNTSTAHDTNFHPEYSQRSAEWISFCLSNVNVTIPSDHKDFYKRCKMQRSEWTFTTDLSYSFVTEFDLVCSKSAVSAFASGSLFLGGLLGCLVAGIIGDTYGRKSVMIASQALVIVSSLACSYSANIWQLTAFRVMLGGSQMACYALGYTALLEFVAPSYRTLCGMLYQMMFCMSQMFIDVVAYFCREWRTLQFYSSFACSLSLLLFFLTPNSPRWLTSQGNHSKAIEILRKFANLNGNTLPKSFTLKSSNGIEKKATEEEEKTNYTYIHLFKTWKLFYTTSILSFIWITCALLYFAIALESSNLGGNMYQAFAFTAVADMPSYFVALFVCSYFGRKKSVLGSLFFAWLFIGGMALVPQTFAHKYVINISLSMLGKFCTTLAFNSIFLWTFEIYPTVLRSQGSSYCVAWERFGALCAPFLITVLQRVSYCLPYVIMSVCSFACVIVGLLLPETKDRPTREKYEDFFNDSNTKKKDLENAEIGCDNKAVEKCNNIEDTHV